MADSINIITLSKTAPDSYACNIPVSKEQWLEILSDETLVRPELRRVLLSFYFMPGHKATSAQCAEEYGHPVNTYNSGVSSLGQAVARRLGTFKVVDNDGYERFWPVIMGEGRNVVVNGSTLFEWTLRKELAEALEDAVIQDAVERYIPEFEKRWADEKYKWEAVQWFREHWEPDDTNLASMIEFATARTSNLLTSMSSYPRGMLINFAKAAPEEVREMFEILFDESLDLEYRVNTFIEKAESVRAAHDPGSWKSHYQTTNAVSTYLWLRYPDKYYIYKYREYRNVIEKLGIDMRITKGSAKSMIKGFGLYDRLNSFLRKNDTFLKTLNERLSADKKLYPDPELRTATIDFGFQISRYIDSLESSLHIKTPVIMTPFISEAAGLLKGKKNLILQGAPGTGKTYNTAALALAIIDGNVPGTHKEVMDRYEELLKENRIGFTTFHQSMDYEDFIEGIRPLQEDNTIRYEVEDGIFKRMCTAARTAAELAASGTDGQLDGLNDNPKIWKVSLGGTFGNPIRKDCMDNGYIRVGWSEHKDFDFDEMEWDGKDGKNVLKAFMKDMQIGDIVVSCWSQDETDAIGIVTGDYEYRAEGGEYPRYREVKWVVKGINHNIREINGGKHMTLGTVYNLYSIALKDILKIIEQYAPTKKVPVEAAERPFVLIIDEINRGNVSKIFGELITLLEKDKRLGDTHPLTLTLPYSKTPFGVPQNLYIIGTMNTTDRSTGTIDYAIRRRFRFLTLPANRDVIGDKTAQELFDDVMAFIEKYKYADMDIEDLMVGHSYFMADSRDELEMKIRYEVIPLLKEYIKDGILSVKPAEAKQYFDSWSKLDTVIHPQNTDDNHTGASED